MWLQQKMISKRTQTFGQQKQPRVKILLLTIDHQSERTQQQAVSSITERQIIIKIGVEIIY